MRPVHWINLILVFLLVGLSALVWPTLPDRIPVHFDAGGEADRWTSPSLLSWFALPLLAIGTVTLNYAGAKLIRRRPNLVNMPEKEQFLQLSAERQAPVIERVQDLLYGISTMIILLFGFIQWVTYRTAYGADSQPYILALLVMSVLMTPLILVLWMPPIQREVRRQLQKERNAKQDAGG